MRTGDTARTVRAIEINREIKRSRMAEYVWLRSDFTLSHIEIAKRMGVSVRTLDRYRKELLANGTIFPRASGIIINQEKHRERVHTQPRRGDGQFIHAYRD